MISGETWILWVHILGVAAWLGAGTATLVAILPSLGEAAGLAAARRAHFLTSRAMEVVVLTGILNIVVRGMTSGMMFGAGFLGMLSVKVALALVMAGLNVWIGFLWKRGDVGGGAVARKARVVLAVQLVLGAVAVLLGLGLRAV